jgi:cellulose synthase/poly-beta-1,6-N-acetylglucosamine synthase-like glycosyltransferase
MAATTTFGIGMFLMPIVWILIDLAAFSRARPGAAVASIPAGTGVHDFALLVPIYGSMRYLENFEFLKDYGRRVILCTTSTESDEFMRELRRVAAAGGFRVILADVPIGPELPPGTSGKKSTSSSKRDTVIRVALEMVDSEFVVCLDADTSTSESIDSLVAAFAARDLDFASIHLVVSNRMASIVTRLQGHEYELSMKLRRVCPWLVSGACHVARTEVHREVMRRHTLFFQANDVEAGLLAEQLGYRVGHIRFMVPTAVPVSARALLRQRYAWVGGEFRLFAINIRYARHHPLFFTYGLGFVIMMFPLRWLAVIEDPWTTLLILFVVYVVVITGLCWKERDIALFLMPFYTLVFTTLVVPFGAISYVQMARASSNKGVIRLDEPTASASAWSGALFDAEMGEIFRRPRPAPRRVAISAVCTDDHFRPPTRRQIVISATCTDVRARYQTVAV